MTRVPLQMYDFRHLKTAELTPPDYRINPQHLIDSCVEMEVKVCCINIIFAFCVNYFINR